MSADAQTRDGETYAIIGAAMEVHRHLGPGFLEAVYHQALMVEMESRGIPYRHEATLPVHYKGIRLDCGYRADFVCFDLVLVEIKAMEQLGGIEKAQVVNYLKATGLPRALLLN
ncbi:MAG: GxxExxY protein, partial [Armatimonadetes bacterium]|nr:GxxExxY protein [Armatimonadota bacterium]